jgi:ABC-type enterochelin transport system permease subunit
MHQRCLALIVSLFSQPAFACGRGFSEARELVLTALGLFVVCAPLAIVSALLTQRLRVPVAGILLAAALNSGAIYGAIQLSKLQAMCVWSTFDQITAFSAILICSLPSYLIAWFLIRRRTKSII